MTNPSDPIHIEAVGNTVDSTTKAVKTIEYPHKEIHSGSHFFLSGTASLDSTDVLNVCVQTPDTTKWPHLLFVIQSTGETETRIYESAVCADDGTTVIPRNNNRNFPDNSVLDIQLDPTINTQGSLISSRLFGVTSNPSKSVGGDIRTDDEIILKQNTEYIFKIISNSDGNNVTYRTTWYEHTND